MEITVLNANQVGKQLEILMNKFANFHWAVAWATEMPLAQLLVSNKKKIQQLVIGTDFAQTSPKILRQLKAVNNAHVMIGSGNATFHPKVYGFVTGKSIAVMIGSANFTNGGTNINSEAVLLLEGNEDDKPLTDILGMVSTWWNGSQAISEEFLTSYERLWESNQKAKKTIKKTLRIYRPTSASTHPQLLSTIWPNYLKEVKSTAGESFKNRIAILERTRQMIDGVAGFDKLSTLQRKAIAGIIERKEKIGTDLENYDWGWFGSMKGAGDFRKLIGNNNVHLSKALGEIPSAGDVSKDNYLAFLEEFRLAFLKSERKGGVPTASRLLAMKRPDYFVCVDKKNGKRLGADLGFAPTTLKLESYWERVIEPILQSNWWNSNRPNGENGKVWDARVAMLDVIYMDWE